MEFLNNKRFHDSLYLKENQYTNPKEYFKFALKLINSLEFDNIANLLDVGCAAGDFLKFLSKNLDLKKYKLFGTDISNELLEACKLKIPQAKFIKYDFGEYDQNNINYFEEKHEIITMFGVHSCFDNLEWIENLSYLLKKNGTAIIFGIFNPYPFDVLMRVKDSDSTLYQSGWNVHSIKSIQKKCKEENMTLEIINYQPDLIISKDNKDFLRAWTIKLDNNQVNINTRESLDNELLCEDEREIIYTNGTRIIHDYCFCILTKL